MASNWKESNKIPAQYVGSQPQGPVGSIEDRYCESIHGYLNETPGCAIANRSTSQMESPEQLLFLFRQLLSSGEEQQMQLEILKKLEIIMLSVSNISSEADTNDEFIRAGAVPAMLSALEMSGNFNFVQEFDNKDTSFNIFLRVLKIISILSKALQASLAFVGGGILVPLVSIVRNKSLWSGEAQLLALQILSNIAAVQKARSEMLDTGCVPAIVAVAAERSLWSLGHQDLALAAIQSLSENGVLATGLLEDPHLLPMLSAVSTDRDLWGQPQQARAMEILAGLSAAEAALERLHDEGFLAAILAVVGDRGLFGWVGHLAAMRALLHLIGDRSGRQAALDAGGLEVLVAVACHHGTWGRPHQEASLQVLWALSGDDDAATRMIRAPGLLDLLSQVVEDGALTGSEGQRLALKLMGRLAAGKQEREGLFTLQGLCTLLADMRDRPEDDIRHESLSMSGSEIGSEGGARTGVGVRRN